MPVGREMNGNGMDWRGEVTRKRRERRGREKERGGRKEEWKN